MMIILNMLMKFQDLKEASEFKEIMKLCIIFYLIMYTKMNINKKMLMGDLLKNVPF